MLRKTAALMLALLLIPTFTCGETLTVNTGSRVHEISPTLYGIFFEDINHAADGGLYAELLQNRSFENEDLLSPSAYQHLSGWQFNTSPEGDGLAAIADSMPLNAGNPTYVSITVRSPGYAFQNLGYTSSVFRGGIPVTEGESYDVSVFLRTKSFTGRVCVNLITRGGQALSDTVSFTPGDAWEKHVSTLTAVSTSDEACLNFTLLGTGDVDIDMASLMPCDRIGRDWPGGGVRRDLFEALLSLHPRFMRFPGGCDAEGSWVWDNLYRWKDTVGPVEARRENWNTWGYMQSYGLGFYEYFCLCEELGALPLPVVGSGVLCQARTPSEKPMNEEELAAWTQDVLDLIEFATGDAGTAWGALRCEMGHEQPFSLKYLAIGNENWGDVYFSRYEKIRDAVRDRYPEITCIVACGPVAEGSLFYASRARILQAFPEDTVDEHYYMDSDWFLRNTHRYDLYPRDTRVFLGEYAAHEPASGGTRPNNLYSALCEAAYMTGLERNSDVVTMSCYAPLMARLGMDQWTPDLIWFSGRDIVKTPNYYVQKLFSDSLGTWLLDSSFDEGNLEAEGLFQTASAADDGRVILKLVNVSGEEKTIHLHLDGKENVQGHGTLLAGDRQDTNALSREKVSPEEFSFELSGAEAHLTLPAWAVLVLYVP
ncbi:MAG: alpha-N-arabinofuranosidase [Clostridia bacterium]|nr:alpha-N-arabinofuranosidase [Clostridia bacterium]